MQDVANQKKNTQTYKPPLLKKDFFDSSRIDNRKKDELSDPLIGNDYKLTLTNLKSITVNLFFVKLIFRLKDFGLNY